MTVGETLSRARQERGLSVEDVTAATRIRSGLVRSIEADEFGPCGGAVYARGHIRNISRVVGIDPEPVVAEFDREHSDEAPAPVVPTPSMDPHDAAKAEPKRANWTAAMAVALVAICVLAGISLIGGGTKKHGTTSANANTPAPHVTSSSPAPPASPPPSAVALADNATLVRVVKDTTWMSVRNSSGVVLFEGLLPAGKRKVFHDAGGLVLRIGNAPAVDLVVHGHDFGAPHATPGNGVVVTVMIRPDGKVQFV